MKISKKDPMNFVTFTSHGKTRRSLYTPIVIRRQAHSTHIPPATAIKKIMFSSQRTPKYEAQQSISSLICKWIDLLNKESFRLQKVYLTT